MLAFGLSLGIFAYFLLIGSVLFRALHATRSRLQDWLLSPVAGFAVVVIVVFTLNRFGVPVRPMGPWVTISLGLLAAIAHLWLNWRNSRASTLTGLLNNAENERMASECTGPTWRAYLPFAGVLLLAAFLTGRAMLTWNFDWVSFCNDDMMNYCLAAERFLNGAFYAAPNTQALLEGRDWTQAYWQLHVAAMVRPGADLTTAWVASTTGLTPHQVFMPLIVSFHLLVVSAAAGLICSRPDRRSVALLTAGLAACAAQITFGTVYQLIAQQVGLSLLCTNMALLCRPFDELKGKALLRHGVLVGVLLTGQLVTYPEVNPFLFGGFVVFTTVALIRKQTRFGRLAKVIGVGAVATLTLLNTYVYDALVFMISQGKFAASGGDVTMTLFPFFLVPSGLANYWGMLTVAGVMGEPALSIRVGIGLMLTIIAVASVLWFTWRGEPAAAMGTVCLMLGIGLFIKDAGFGLYKLAMFTQPFVLGTLALAWVTLVRKKWWAVPLLLIISVPSVRTQSLYVDYSQDLGGATFNEVPGATKSLLVREFREQTLPRAWEMARARGDKEPHLLCDSYNISLTKLLTPYTRGIPMSLPASPFTLKTLFSAEPLGLGRAEIKRQANEMNDAMMKRIIWERFDFEGGTPLYDRPVVWYVVQGGRELNAPVDDPSTIVLATTPRTNLLNRRRFSPDTKKNFELIPYAEARNHLLFTTSSKSLSYFDTGDPTYMAIFQLERDTEYPSHTMAGIGPYLLCEVLNPDEKIRLCLELSTSMKADGQNTLPNADVVGENRASFGFVGRGAARVFSEPVTPKRLHGRYYVVIDMNELGKMFPMRRNLLMGLFGNRVAMDRRRLVGFARDVSAISEDQYAALKPPTVLRDFSRSSTNALRERDLEFSGVYEDGYVAERSFVALAQPPGHTKLVIKGMVGKVDDTSFTTTLTLRVDGRPVTFRATQEGKPVIDGQFGLGGFELSADVPITSATRRRIEMNFSRVQPLPHGDSRPVAARLNYLALEPATPVVAGR